MNKKVLILLAVVWTAALGLVGFSELRPENPAESGREAASAGPVEPESTGRDFGEKTRAERQTAGGSNSVVPDADSGGPEPEGVTLQVGGEPGLEFSGRCTVDGEEHELGGETPRSYSYEPEQRLGCEISSRDRGPLRVTFDGGGTDTTQQVGPGPASLELTYTGNSLSTSTSSGFRKGGSQVSRSQSSQMSSSQTSSSQINSQVTQVNSSNVSSSQSSSQSSSSVVRSGSE